MRTVTLLIAASLAQSLSAAPHITAHVSHEDLAKIVAAVHAVTRDPILSIGAVNESKPVPGSIPRTTKTIDILGPGRTRMRDITIYERTDRVGVSTGDYRNLKGGSYLVVRHGDTWRVQGKSFWIH